MKNQTKLRQSYQRQKDVFDQATERKISNIVEQLDSISLKIRKLEKQREQLLQQKDKMLKRSFQTEEDFIRTAEEKSLAAQESKEKKEEAKSPSTDNSSNLRQQEQSSVSEMNVF